MVAPGREALAHAAGVHPIGGSATLSRPAGSIQARSWAIGRAVDGAGAVLDSTAMNTFDEESRLQIDFDPRAGQYTAMLTLEGAVTFREAPELQRQLRRAVETHPDRNLVVELSRVDRFDTAAMAVLLEVLMQTHQHGPEVYLVGANEVVTKVFRLAGFEEALLRCFGCMDDVRQQIAS